MAMKGGNKLSYNDIGTIEIMVFIFVFFYATVVMPQKKREKALIELQGALKVGDEVVMFAGIVGKIIHINNDMLTIEASAEKTKLNIMKWAVKELKVSK